MECSTLFQIAPTGGMCTAGPMGTASLYAHAKPSLGHNTGYLHCQPTPLSRLTASSVCTMTCKVRTWPSSTQQLVCSHQLSYHPPSLDLSTPMRSVLY